MTDNSLQVLWSCLSTV